MIKLLAGYKVPDINPGTWEEFISLLTNSEQFEFDIETNMTPYWCTKKIATMQFGFGHVQYVIDYQFLLENKAHLKVVKAVLESWDILKLIHTASFEYIVCKFHGIEIHNVFCTMVAEKIIKGGEENEDYRLTDLTYKYCDVVLDKTLQTSFGQGQLITEQVIYAADDVKYLTLIKKFQDTILASMHASNVVWLEMRTLLGLSDCTFYGIALNVEAWRKNINLASPFVYKAKAELDAYLKSDLILKAKAIELGYLSNTDTILYSLNSPKQKLTLLQLLFPDLQGASKAFLEKYSRTLISSSFDKKWALASLIEGDPEPLNRLLISNYRDQLIELGMIQPAGEPSINWNSQPQVLPLLQAVDPKLKDLSEESMNKFSHPIGISLENYKDSLKLMSTYGEKFIEKYLEPDGMVRTNYNSIVKTGRVSSMKPNMQQIPAKEELENRYRNAFVYNLNWDLVDSDFRGQELALIAHVAQDDVWFEAINSGKDLHSVCAELVFKDKWKKAAEPGCAYYKNQDKCKCKGHKSLRNGIKTINFGLAYGMSEFKLAATLKISVPEAKSLIEEYFRTFPKIKAVLQYLGNFAVTKGYTETLQPFSRRRVFPYWEKAKHEIDAHISGVKNSYLLGKIERAGKNTPIQGSAGDMMKLAIWLVYKYIRDHKLQDKVHILLTVHDQLTTACVADYAEEWKDILDGLMIKAAKYIIPSGILKADTTVSPFWTK